MMFDSGSEDLPLRPDFAWLAAARREWIEKTLRVWCLRAPLKELRKAEQEWLDIAGRADAKATLWTWAWERFPEIVHPEMPGVHEASAVTVTLRDGTTLSGFPDARQSLRGELTLVGPDHSGTIVSQAPVTIDDIVAVIKSS